MTSYQRPKESSEVSNVDDKSKTIIMNDSQLISSEIEDALPALKESKGGD